MSFEHVPVMREQVVEILGRTPQTCLVDATIGLGGHAEALLRAFPAAQLVGIDRDPQALRRAERHLWEFKKRVELVPGAFGTIDTLLRSVGVETVSGALFDLGVSSLQIDDSSRGFSYLADGPLDMRMDPQQARTAADLINEATENEIATVLRHWGEERFARRIARKIVARRQSKKLSTTSELSEIVRGCVSGRKPVSSLARVFQGVRMWTNGEWENLTEGLRRVLGVLAPGAIVVVLSYHSIEDRFVKRFFREQVNGCVCPPDLPRCGCGFVAEFELLTGKALRASEDETRQNVRSRSVRLRALRRLAA